MPEIDARQLLRDFIAAVASELHCGVSHPGAFWLLMSNTNNFQVSAVLTSDNRIALKLFKKGVSAPIVIGIFSSSEYKAAANALLANA